MRNGVVAVGRLAGIPLKIHFSWIIVFFLVTTMLAKQWYPTRLPGEPASFYIGLALITAFFVFASVVAHELAHALVARWFGVPVRAIVLFLFGGVAEMVGEPRRAFQEAAVAAAGPAASLFIAMTAGLGAVMLPPGVVRAALETLLMVNLGLFAFNVIPAFPLDGGRIARAVIWAMLGHYQHATLAATVVGVGFAGLLGVGGLFVTLTTGAMGGLWLAFVAVFVGHSAVQAYRRAHFTHALREGRVEEITDSGPPLDPEMTLAEVVALRPGALQAGFAIGGPLMGYLDADLVDEVPRDQWTQVRLADVMVPASALVTLRATDPLELLFRAFAMNRAPAAVVVRDDGQHLGVAGRGALLDYFQRLQG
jgi:Zn-dependent protease